MTDRESALLADVRAALNAISPWPWRANVADHQEDDPSWFIVQDATAHGLFGIPVPSSLRQRHSADVEFVAHAPVWLAQLCDAVETLERERDALRTSLEEAQWIVLNGCNDQSSVEQWDEWIPRRGQWLQSAARLTSPPSDPT